MLIAFEYSELLTGDLQEETSTATATRAGCAFLNIQHCNALYLVSIKAFQSSPSFISNNITLFVCSCVTVLF